ncbi:MAG: hypothetical protein NTZ80_03735 [Patescibacteria group bacterium]|nr:hypothetical protein [Patescibacteria group bacterium]
MFIKKLLSATLVSCCILTLAGCGDKTKQDPIEVLSKMTEKVVDLESGVFDASFSIAGNSPESKVDLQFKLTGKEDKSDLAKPAFDINANVKGSVEMKEGKYAGEIGAEIIQKDKSLYFKLNDIKMDGEMAMLVNLMADGYKGKWYEMPTSTLLGDANMQKLDKQEEMMQAVRDVIAETPLFDLRRDNGIEKINDIDSFHYTVGLNRDGVKQLARKMMELSGEKVYDEEMRDLDAQLDTLNQDIDLWIDIEDYYLMKLSMNVVGSDPEDEKSSYDVRLTVNMTEHDESIDVEEPEDAATFDPSMLAQGLFGNALPNANPETMGLVGDITASGAMLDLQNNGIEAIAGSGSN